MDQISGTAQRLGPGNLLSNPATIKGPQKSAKSPCRPHKCNNDEINNSEHDSDVKNINDNSDMRSNKSRNKYPQLNGQINAQ